jgi:2-polyprenyl-3-methyl-5-hydroxy-6-metoxy-1,4-benzoquinol methylase
MMSLRTRSAELEIMDDLDCHGEVVDQTLRELEVINRLLGGDNVTIDGIAKLATIKDRSYTIADCGCGGGDLAMKIERWGRRKKLDLKVVGVDANPHIVAFAKRQYPDIAFLALDVFSDEFKKQTYDIITATLFVHHFDDNQLVELFSSMRSQARIGVVINDIHRHNLSYYSIRLLTSLFSRSAMVKFDAPLSVRRAFKRKELIRILDKAGIKNYSLKWKWAFRWQLILA